MLFGNRFNIFRVVKLVFLDMYIFVLIIRI